MGPPSPPCLALVGFLHQVRIWASPEAGPPPSSLSVSGCELATPRPSPEAKSRAGAQSAGSQGQAAPGPPGTSLRLALPLSLPTLGSRRLEGAALFPGSPGWTVGLPHLGRVVLEGLLQGAELPGCPLSDEGALSPPPPGAGASKLQLRGGLRAARGSGAPGAGAERRPQMLCLGQRAPGAAGAAQGRPRGGLRGNGISAPEAGGWTSLVNKGPRCPPTPSGA